LILINTQQSTKKYEGRNKKEKTEKKNQDRGRDDRIRTQRREPITKKKTKNKGRRD
jgi:hypothetical protein